jgi:hypothetical protein
VKVMQLNDTSSNHPQASPVAFDDVTPSRQTSLPDLGCPRQSCWPMPKRSSLSRTVVSMPCSRRYALGCLSLPCHCPVTSSIRPPSWPIMRAWGCKLDMSKMTSDDLFVCHDNSDGPGFIQAAGASPPSSSLRPAHANWRQG